MNNKLIRKAVFALLGAAIAVAVVAAPLTAQAYSVTRPEPGVTVRSYDMDEYLDMLLATGQHEKYDRFAKIADAESWAKHIAHQNSWEAKYPVYVWKGQDLLDAVIAHADRLGFDARRDTFTLLYLDDERAAIKVRHDGQHYILKLKAVSYHTWEVRSMFRVE